MYNLLYALVTSHCNLTCPYCDVTNCKEEFNRDLFMKQLHEFDGDIILFGGEPTLYPDRLVDIFLSDPIVTRKIHSITTNLIDINDQILSILHLIHRVGTSWNPSRFRDGEYEKWRHNLDIVSEKIPDISLRVLVTMTFEVLDMSPREMMDKINSWNGTVVDDINFEFLIDDAVDEKYFERCDNWLCDLYKIWNSDIKFFNIERIRNWFNDCTGIRTLHPNGIMTEGCPHAGAFTVPDKCLTCDKSDVCRPCRLQKYCSYAHKFAELAEANNYKPIICK